MGVGLKDAVQLEAATTVKVAVEVFPVPPFVEYTVTLLVFVPVVLGVTLTLKLHEPLAARVAPDSITKCSPRLP